MAMIRIDGLDEAMREVLRRSELGAAACKDALKDVALAYQADVQKAAPVDTGQYRSEIYVRPRGSGWVVGSPAPQAARLEYGFNGPDSRGREYNQRAQPHWEPPLEYNIEEYRNIIVRKVNEAVH